MSVYSYRAKNFEGKELAGELDAPDIASLTARLKGQGYVLLDVSAGNSGVEVSGKSILSLSRLMKLGGNIQIFKSVKLSERMIFTRNLAVMIAAGLSVSRALDALAHETKSEYFREVINGVNEGVKTGATLKESFAKYPNVFNSLYISMVEAGEESGNLVESLNVLAKQMRADGELKKRVKGAMLYPAIVVTVMIMVGITMLVYIVPLLVATFEDLGVEIPAATRAMVTISDFFIHYGIFLLLSLPFIFFGLKKYFGTTSGKHILDTVIIRIPLIGPMNKKFNAARASRTMSSLLGAGVAISNALEISAHVLQNHFFSDVLMEAKDHIQKGNKMSEVFAKYPQLYPSLLTEMIAVGEETGKTSSMLEEVAAFYEGEVEQATKDLSGVIEPILMVIIGIGVGIFAVSMIQPLYGIVNAI